MAWRDCDGNELSIGDPVTLVGPIAGREVLGRGKHGSAVEFSHVDVQVLIDRETGSMAGERPIKSPLVFCGTATTGINALKTDFNR